MEKVEQNIVKQALRFKQPIPERIANKPELLKGLNVYLQAFLDLSSDRFNEIIAWSSIVRYSEYYGFDFEQTEDLIYFIRNMDAAYLKHVSKKSGK